MYTSLWGNYACRQYQRAQEAKNKKVEVTNTHRAEPNALYFAKLNSKITYAKTVTISVEGNQIPAPFLALSSPEELAKTTFFLDDEKFLGISKLPGMEFDLTREISVAFKALRESDNQGVMIEETVFCWSEDYDAEISSNIRKHYKSIVDSIKLQEACASPHVVKIYSALIESINIEVSRCSRIYVISELAQWGNLTQLPRELSSKCSELQMGDEEILAVMRHIVKGLQVCHANGVIHRNINASSIFVFINNAGNIVCKIGNFTLARHITGAGERCVSAVGLRSNMAPEMLRELCTDLSSTSYSSAVDIWNVGTTLHSMLTGKPLLKSKRNTDLMFAELQRLANENESHPGQVWLNLNSFSPEIAEIIGKTLYVCPEKRPTANELAELLG